MTTKRITKTTEQLDQEAYEITKELEKYERFSEKWMEVMKKAEKWTKENNRPLYYTYND